MLFSKQAGERAFVSRIDGLWWPAVPGNRLGVSFLFVACGLACIPIASAQITNVTNDQAAPTPGAGHDYIGILNETVNPST